METKVQITATTSLTEANPEAAQIFTAGVGGLGELVVEQGRFKPGERFEVVVSGGKVGYMPVAEKGPLEAADYSLASESLAVPSGRQASQSAVMVAGEGILGELVVQQGQFKPGERFRVVTDGGKTGFLPVAKSQTLAKESA